MCVLFIAKMTVVEQLVCVLYVWMFVEQPSSGHAATHGAAVSGEQSAKVDIGYLQLSPFASLNYLSSFLPPNCS